MYFYHTFAGINFKLTQVNITAMIIEDGLVETKYKSGLFFAYILFRKQNIFGLPSTLGVTRL